MPRFTCIHDLNRVPSPDFTVEQTRVSLLHPLVKTVGDLPKVTYKLAYRYWAYSPTTCRPFLSLPYPLMTPWGVLIKITGQYHQCSPTQWEAALKPTQIMPESHSSCFHADSIRALPNSQGSTYQILCILAKLWLRAYFKCLPLNIGSLEKTWAGNYSRRLNCSVTLYKKLMAFPPKLYPPAQDKWLHFPVCALN